MTIQERVKYLRCLGGIALYWYWVAPGVLAVYKWGTFAKDPIIQTVEKTVAARYTLHSKVLLLLRYVPFTLKKSSFSIVDMIALVGVATH